MGNGAEVTISAAVVMLTQAIKPMVPDGCGLIISGVLSVLGVCLYAASNTGFAPVNLWPMFSQFVQVFGVAVAVFSVSKPKPEPVALIPGDVLTTDTLTVTR